MRKKKHPKAVRTLMSRIALGLSHRASHQTYDYLVKNGLASYHSDVGWKLTQKGWNSEV